MKIKNDNKLIILGVIVIIILIGVAIKTVMSNKKVDVSKLSDEEVAEYMNEKIDYLVKKDLSELGERDRMEYYVSSFITSVEEGKYEEAYEMLYDDYKANFFPQFNDFKEYAESKFPKFAAVEHTNIERNGDIYVLWTKFSDSLGSKDAYKEIKFVVKEYDLNDFKLSFSADL